MTRDYKLHKVGNTTTAFVKGNGIYGHYMIHGDKVSKVIEHEGDQIIEPFHTIGQVATNSEAQLFNELRKRGEL